MKMEIKMENKNQIINDLENKLNYITIFPLTKNIKTTLTDLKEEGLYEVNEKDRIIVDKYTITQLKYDKNIFSQPPTKILDKYAIKYELPTRIGIPENNQ